MIYHLIYPLHETYSALRVFKYISFRLFMCILTSLFISFVLGPPLIRLLKRIQKDRSSIREDVPENHKEKEGTPSMGGVLIVTSLLSSVLLWARWDNPAIMIACAGTLFFGLIGFWDDYQKMTRKRGISSKQKIFWQVFSAGILSALIVFLDFDLSLQFPFFKNLSPTLPPLVFACFSLFVIVGASNSVNLTDGLDGLAIGPVLVCSLTFLILAYVAGHELIAEYLHIIFVEEAGELAIFCGAMMGAGLGFLWFNTYPAQVFMGDVGSLSLGAALGLIALLVKQEILLAVSGGMFVVETLSVILQVLSYKLTGRRIFRMAPLHHHYELKGLSEPKLIVRFWIVSIILAILSLVSLKLR